MIRLLPSLLVFAALAACSTKDRDGDGVPDGEDCNADDPGSSSGGTEVCDGADNDCDGEVDEGLTSMWYADADGDGWGDPNTFTDACGAPEGYVAVADDCADTDPNRHPGAQETDCTNPTDLNCDGSVGYADADADGVPACQDCDDAAAGTFPGAAEVCDDVDNDCDTDVDEDAVDAPTWAMDYDGDTFGDERYSVSACDNPDSALFVENTDDCNDLSPLAYPGATEVCDGLDNDCNGLVDAMDPGVTDAFVAYPDADGDGFGDDALAQVSCVGLAGFVDIGGDCDDNQLTGPEVNPDAEELCNNSVDDDCDPSTPCAFDADRAQAIWSGASGDDLAGQLSAGTGDVDGDGLDDFLIGAPEADADADGDAEGAAYFVRGNAAMAAASSVSDADIVFRGEGLGDQAGVRVALVNDMDGDGRPEIAVTASAYNGHPSLARTKNGVAYLFRSSSLPAGAVDLGDASNRYFGDRNFDFLGSDVRGVGDLDNDGDNDLLVGVSGDDDGGAQSGSVVLFSGGSGGLADTQQIPQDGFALIHGQAANERIGTAAEGPGDLDGDGVDDLVLGTRFATAGAVESGALYLALGPVSGTRSVAALDATLSGAATGDALGASVAARGDVALAGARGDIDGDGYADIFAGASRTDVLAVDGGSVYLLRGGPTIAADWAGATVDTVAAASLHGSAPADGIGAALAAGDIDGDGEVDLFIGSPGGGVASQGQVWVAYGPFSGSLGVEAASIGRARGESADDDLGSTIALVGDVFGDGGVWAAAGAPTSDRAGRAAGAVYLIPGLTL